jgi:hypothetical protein
MITIPVPLPVSVLFPLPVFPLIPNPVKNSTQNSEFCEQCWVKSVERNETHLSPVRTVYLNSKQQWLALQPSPQNHAVLRKQIPTFININGRTAISTSRKFNLVFFYYISSQIVKFAKIAVYFMNYGSVERKTRVRPSSRQVISNITWKHSFWNFDLQIRSCFLNIHY